jgi:hypothetical protein
LPAAREFKPVIEVLEDRWLLSAGAFLQGTAFIDANQDHTLDPGDPYLSGAIVSLYQGTTVSPATLLAAATTDANGAYLFDDANVPTSFGNPGLNPGTYTLVQTPPPGFVNDATQVLSQLNPATAVDASTIQVTLLDPSQIFISFNSKEFFNRNAWDFLQQTLNGVTHKQSAGQLPVTPVNANDLTLQSSNAGVTNKSAVVTLSDTSGLSVGETVKITDGTTTLYSVISSISPNTSITLADQWTGSTGSAASVYTLAALNNPFLTLCWDLQHFLEDGTNVFQVVPTSGQGAPPNSGRIAYLYNHYGTVDISTLTGTNPITGLPQGTSAQAVGLQVAVWELEYGANFTDLLVLSKQNNTSPAVVAQELSDVNTWASFYVNDSAGKSETATFLQIVGSPLQGGFQGMLATGSFNFGNVPQGGHKVTPTIVTVPGPGVVLGSGVPLTDSATLSEGNNPTGSITFTLTAPDGVTVVDTETVAVNGNGTYTTPHGFVPATAGTFQWVASYSGDQNNNPATSPFGDEPETVTGFPIVPPNFAGKVLLLGSVWTSSSSQEPLVAFTLFVNGLYQKLLNRPPNQNEVNAWVAQLAAGISREQVASTIFQSPEHRALQVDGYFQTFLGRNPLPAEQAVWVNVFLAGATETAVEQTILLSPEYQALHAENAGLVAGLFSDLLGRSATPAEQAVWEQALQQGLSRSDLVRLVLNSGEYLARVVSQDYSLFLRRTASPQEALNWVGLLQNGAFPLGFVAEQVLASAEFYANPI